MNRRQAGIASTFLARRLIALGSVFMLIPMDISGLQKIWSANRERTVLPLISQATEEYALLPMNLPTPMPAQQVSQRVQPDQLTRNQGKREASCIAPGC